MDYPWSSYHFNALGQENRLIKPHVVYKSLGVDETARQSNYQVLFDSHIPKADIDEIRASTNKAWVLGNDKFKAKIEQMLDRQIVPKQRGGDRRSKSFMKKDIINRV